LNRRVLHPRGIAIEVTVPEEPGSETTAVRIWDCRHDPEGILFSEQGFVDGLAKFTQYMNNLGVRTLVARRACLGYRIQGEMD
jgi:hypothetical protein